MGFDGTLADGADDVAVSPLSEAQAELQHPKRGAEIETLVVNVQDGSEGCWPCIAGPDQMMLRKVAPETETGTEVVLVHARNNCEAFRMAGFGRTDVLRGIATPLAN